MSAKIPAREALNQLCDWLFASDSLADKMKAFAVANCHEFPVVEDRDLWEGLENKLVYTELYKRFQELFEGSLQQQLTALGWSNIGEFVAALQAEGAEGEGLQGLETLLLLSDYGTFKIMMLEQRLG